MGKVGGLAAFSLLWIAFSASAEPCRTTGVQRLAVIHASFPGQPIPAALSRAQLQQDFFGTSGLSLDRFWREQSGGRASASGRVYPGAGSYALDRAYEYNGDSFYHRVFESVARVAAREIRFDQVDRVVVFVPKVKNAYGISTFGCVTIRTASGTFHGSVSVLDGTIASTMRQAERISLIAHEIGHGLGLDHASFVRLAAPGQMRDVDDGTSPFDVMGGSNSLAPYNVLDRIRLGWMAASEAKWTETAGRYRVAGMSSASSAAKLLWVRRGATGGWLGVEFQNRKPETSPGYPAWRFPRVFVYSRDPGHPNDARTYLVDNLTLKTGVTWRDPHTRLTLTIVEQGAEELVLQVGN